MRRAVALLGLVVTTSLWSLPAGAARVDVEALANVSLAAWPAAPLAIRATERERGITWLPAQGDGGPTLTADEAGCLSTEDSPTTVTAPGGAPLISSGLALGTEGPTVGTFRVERLTSEPQQKTLLVDRGFFDRRSGGIRHVDTVAVPLLVLSHDPLVYGFRDGATLQVVFPVEPGAQAMTVRGADGKMRSFSCGHARGGLPLDTAGGSTVIFTEAIRGPGPRPGSRVFPGTLILLSLSASRTSQDPVPWVSLSVGRVR
jgi:hypothetical protein